MANRCAPIRRSLSRCRPPIADVRLHPLLQEIHAKIMSLGFSDCKVYISNVDSQSSAEGGHILQVIGEMSNKSLPWRKFSQTFFLAEQPNGYFVLNDICRYIKEEGDEEEGKEEEALPNHDLAFGAEPVYAAPGPPAPVVDVAPIDAPILTNGIHHEEEAPIVVVPSLPTPPQAAIIVQEAPIVEAIEPVVVETPNVEEIKPVVAAPLPVVVAPIAPLPTPTVVATLPTPTPIVIASTPAPVPTPAPVAAPAPIVAPAPKSWANLAASNQTKWGSQAVVSKTTSAAPIAPPAPSSSDRTKSTSKSSSDSPPFAASVMAITSTSCFVKGVVETVSEKVLRDLLVTRFGPLRELDIKRAKACAFIEFETLLSARKAIQVSLRVQEGGEGNIVVDREGGGFDLINVVTKKATGDRPVSNSTRGGRMGAEGGAGGRGGGGGDDRGAKNGGYGRGANEEGGRSASGNGGVRNGAGATRGNGGAKTGGGPKSANNK